jgi:coenzyme F420-reducing hydrogenase delta subunit
MERRLGLLRAVLRSRNIDDNRMRIIHIARNEGDKLNTELKALSVEIKSMHRQ